MSDATLARMEHGKYVGVRGEPRRDGVYVLRKPTLYGKEELHRPCTGQDIFVGKRVRVLNRAGMRVGDYAFNGCFIGAHLPFTALEHHRTAGAVTI